MFHLKPKSMRSNQIERAARVGRYGLQPRALPGDGDRLKVARLPVRGSADRSGSPIGIVAQMDVELAVVGRNMAELRAAKGLRLADLAEATGYTTSRLSQIERGVSIPSLTALAMVAMALGVEMAALLDSSSGPLVHITRAGEGRELRLSTGPTFRVVGSHGLDGAYTAVVLGTPDRVEYRHYGERFILLLSGSATFTFGDDRYHLSAGDTIHYASHKTHEVVTTSKVPGRLLVITCPALF